MRLALDTNRYADLAADLPEAVEVVSHATEIVLPFVVLAELHRGFRGGTRRHDNEQKLKRLLDQDITRVVYADADTVSLWADLMIYARSRGRTLPINDVWIASLCVQHGARLYSRDAHFDQLPQVMRA